MIYRIELTKVCSWLFHNEPENKTRIKIYDALYGIGDHPRTPMPPLAELFKDLKVLNDIARVRTQLKTEAREREAFLKKLTKKGRKK
jgi:hypothetical protein